MPNEEDIYAFKALLLRWLSGEEPDDAERLRLQQWAATSPDHRRLLDQLQDNDWLGGEVGRMNAVETDKHWQIIEEKLHQPMVFRRRLMRVVGIAAAFILLIGIGLRIGKWRTNTSSLTPTPIPADLVLTSDKIAAADVATHPALTLEDGVVIVLDNDANGSLPDQKGIAVRQEGRNKIIYSHSAVTETTATTTGRDNNRTISYNTLTVPRGMQFELVLTDGSHVWLNNASTLRYPVPFTGKQRDLALTGEAYFEVAKMPDMPLRVWTPSFLTDVLGTNVNIRDYPSDHSPRTTLLEGKVAVHKGHDTKILSIPGQEAQTRGEDSALQVVDIDPAKRVAWKDGFFFFDSGDIRANLREVARWYQKDFLFKAGAETAQLGQGRFKKNKPLPQLLQELERDDLHFRIGDSIIIVSR